MTQVATITLTGPSNVWFGVGFDAQFLRFTGTPTRSNVLDETRIARARFRSNHIASVFVNVSTGLYSWQEVFRGILVAWLC